MWPGFPVFTVHALGRDVVESWQCPQQLLATLTPLLKVKSICEMKAGWDQWQPIQIELDSKRLLSTQGCCLAQDADPKDIHGQPLHLGSLGWDTGDNLCSFLRIVVSH